jgi:hypothetical protein
MHTNVYFRPTYPFDRDRLLMERLNFTARRVPAAARKRVSSRFCCNLLDALRRSVEAEGGGSAGAGERRKIEQREPEQPSQLVPSMLGFAVSSSLL